MDLKEMIEKTGIIVQGINKGIQEFVSQKTGKRYYSVDVEVKGCRLPINISLPETYKISSLVQHELVKLNCIIKPGFDGKGIKIEAVA